MSAAPPPASPRRFAVPAAFIGLGLIWGSSFLCDAFGRVLAEAGQRDEQILIGEVDLSCVEETRRNWPFLRDRRIDAYGGITRRFLDET